MRFAKDLADPQAADIHHASHQKLVLLACLQHVTLAREGDTFFNGVQPIANQQCRCECKETGLFRASPGVCVCKYVSSAGRIPWLRPSIRPVLLVEAAAANVTLRQTVSAAHAAWTLCS